MVGIFVGSTPITSMGSAIAEVYVGATKVWPTSTGSFVKYYGMNALRGTINANNPEFDITWQSNPGITLTLPQVVGAGTINWGYVNSLFGLFGQATATGTNSNRRIVVPGEPFAASDSSYQTAYQGTSLSNTGTAAKLLTTLEKDDGLVEEYARFDANGNLVFSTVPGFTCVNNSTGLYIVTAPFSLQGQTIFASPVSAADIMMAGQVQEIDELAGTFQVTMWRRTTIPANSGFSVVVIRA